MIYGTCYTWWFSIAMLNLPEGIISKIPTASKCRGEQSGSWNLRRMNTSRIRFCFGPCWFKTYEPHQSSESPIDFHFGHFHDWPEPWDHIETIWTTPIGHADFILISTRSSTKGTAVFYAHPEQPWFPIQNYIKGGFSNLNDCSMIHEKKHGWLWFK